MRSFSVINIALILLIATSTILGQTYEISGVIKDDAGKKVPNARITLYNKKLFLLRTDRSKGNGKFKLRKVPPANYTLNLYGAGGYALSMEVDLRSSAKTNLA
ncbi:MAG: carboxypeptidase-like regulatory domain-containing protein, partial [Candidatus Neomarinimicrobiota bacterium]|nr:carboxypeptidase-like regulatory domain-containing protein [Candidatus Neomarinimicrobiota bacterium]